MLITVWILVASDTLGFEDPKICVQVKTSDTLLDRPTLDQLIGTMSNYSEDFGLLVSGVVLNHLLRKKSLSISLRLAFGIQKPLFNRFLKITRSLATELRKRFLLRGFGCWIVK